MPREMTDKEKMGLSAYLGVAAEDMRVHTPTMAHDGVGSSHASKIALMAAMLKLTRGLEGGKTGEDLSKLARTVVLLAFGVAAWEDMGEVTGEIPDDFKASDTQH